MASWRWWPTRPGRHARRPAGITADNGNAGGSDGNVDTVSVIDLEANTVTNTGTLIKLPGKPASMRGRTQ